MIIAKFGKRLRVVTQSDHAHFSGALLALWHADGMPGHPRRQVLIFAAREHDNGWREVDAAPRIDPESGRPYDFVTLPREPRQELWHRSVRRHAETHPYAALLIVEHALNLHRRQRGKDDWEECLASWRELYDELLEATGSAPAEVRADYRWIDLTDLISLATAGGWRKTFSRHGVRGRVTPDRAGTVARLALEPFPLAGATTFNLPCRWIAARPYESDSDLGLELARARWQELAVRVMPA